MKRLLPLLAVTLSIISCDSPTASNDSVSTAKNTLTEMKLIPALGQSFTMGKDNGDMMETPAHQVSFTYNFYMDSTEITQTEYDETMGKAYESYTKNIWNDTLGGHAGLGYPVNGVNFFEAVLYCNARSKNEGKDTVYLYSAIDGKIDSVVNNLEDFLIDYRKKGYRLPTEAEWEFACRAGTITDYYWEFNDLNNYAWHQENANYELQKIAQKKPNAYGLYDMAGNVKEWCNDFYVEYSGAPKVDPTGAKSGYSRVIRGGAYKDMYDFVARTLRSSYRESASSNYAGNYGFRTVLQK